MKKVIGAIISFYSYIWNNKTQRNFKIKKDKLYSMWLLKDLKSKGSNIFLMRPIELIGEEYIEIGSNTHVNSHCILSAWSNSRNDYFEPKLKIGSNCNFGEYSHITCAHSINIGNNVLTGRWVTITDNAHGRSDYAELLVPPLDRKLYSKGPVVIEDNVWIGDKATILPNVKLGKGCVVAANAVVTKDMPAFSIVAGNPARVVKLMSKE